MVGMELLIPQQRFKGPFENLMRQNAEMISVNECQRSYIIHAKTHSEHLID